MRRAGVHPPTSSRSSAFTRSCRRSVRASLRRGRGRPRGRAGVAARPARLCRDVVWGGYPRRRCGEMLSFKDPCQWSVRGYAPIGDSGGPGMNSRTAITVNRPRDEVERLWRSAEYRPSYIDDADAAVTFKEAPGDRGTEIHIDLSTPGGKLGEVV